MNEMISNPTELAVRESEASYDTHKALVASHEVAENKALVSTAESNAIGELVTSLADKVTEDAGLVRVGESMSPDVPGAGPRKHEDRQDVDILADTNGPTTKAVVQFADIKSHQALLDKRHMKKTKEAIKEDQIQARKRARQSDNRHLLREAAVKMATDTGVEIKQ